jgi:hypothetical protein
MPAVAPDFPQLAITNTPQPWPCARQQALKAFDFFTVPLKLGEVNGIQRFPIQVDQCDTRRKSRLHQTKRVFHQLGHIQILEPGGFE